MGKQRTLQTIPSCRFAHALILFLMTTLCVSSQEGLSVHLGPSIPLGAFADDFDFDTDGAASIGIGVGLQYVRPVMDQGLGVFGGIDILFHGLNKDIKDELKDDNPGVTFTFEKYINIPVSVGAHYTLAVSDGLAVYGKLGPTASFLKMTKFVWEEPGDPDYIETYSFSATVGVLFGAGVVLNDQIEIGLSLMGLGKHKIEGEEEFGNDRDTFDFERKVGLFNLVVGYVFP